MTEINLVQSMHASTERNYVQRVVEHDKAEIRRGGAAHFGRDYSDGERRYGYGGYRYDGRWRPLAQTLIDRYGIKPGMSVLDVGCGKGFLLYEFTQLVTDLKIAGIDISQYGVDNAKKEVRPKLEARPNYPSKASISWSRWACCTICRWKTSGVRACTIERVGRGSSKYVMVECSVRTRKGESAVLAAHLPKLP